MGLFWGWLVLLAIEVPFAELPKPVQRTINRSLEGGMVQSVNRVSGQTGTIYHVTIRLSAGAPRVLQILGDGQLFDPVPSVRVSQVRY